MATKKPAANKRGPKGKYQKWIEPHGLTQIIGWARNGLTNEQIAHNMGINRATLCAWQKKYDEINTALKNSREVADLAVENALYKRAMNGDTTAQIFWLKNRKPEAWRDKPSDKELESARLRLEQSKVDVELTRLDIERRRIEAEAGISHGKGTNEINLSELSDEEVRVLLHIAEKSGGGAVDAEQ